LALSNSTIYNQLALFFSNCKKFGAHAQKRSILSDFQISVTLDSEVAPS